MAKRSLLAEEIERVRKRALARERHNYPVDASIEIIVHRETNPAGEARYVVLIRRERVIPREEMSL